MSHLLIMLPILCFCSFFVLLVSRSTIETSHNELAPAFIYSALSWGVLAILISEGLSLFGILTSTAVAIAWGAILVASLALIWKMNAMARFQDKLRANMRDLERMDYLLLGCFGVIILLLWIVAWFSPPNNADSQLYHMSRVVHWAQNQSLRHYPTAFEPQLWHPIWAENAILHFRLLWGDDRPANLVQWFSMLGLLFLVVAIARSLGANRWGKWIAAAYAISLPIGILQSTSTQNDYATGFWFLCFIYFALNQLKRKVSIVEKVGLASSLALGLATKGTFYPYAAAIGLWLVISWVRGREFRHALTTLALIVGATLFLNGGCWMRNIKTYVVH